MSPPPVTPSPRPENACHPKGGVTRPDTSAGPMTQAHADEHGHAEAIADTHGPATSMACSSTCVSPADVRVVTRAAHWGRGTIPHGTSGRRVPKFWLPATFSRRPLLLPYRSPMNSWGVAMPSAARPFTSNSIASSQCRFLQLTVGTQLARVWSVGGHQRYDVSDGRFWPVADV